MMPGRQQVRCPECGRQVDLDEAGMVAGHQARVFSSILGATLELLRRCPHSGKSPSWREG